MTTEVNWNLGFLYIVTFTPWLDQLLYPYYHMNAHAFPFKVDSKKYCDKRRTPYPRTCPPHKYSKFNSSILGDLQ